MLEFQGAFLAIALPANSDIRCHEADYLKVIAELVGGPDLTVLGFERFTAAWIGIDFGYTLAAEGFSGVGHLTSPRVGDAPEMYN